MTGLPLDGCRVLDFSWVWAGPLLGAILADMGAEVIKVESRKRLDAMRMTADNVERDPEKDPMFHSVNRGKLGVTVNITHPRGADLVKRLAAVSDVVVENFSAGVMERRGLGQEQLRAINPRLIVISLSGAGQNGPLRDLVSYAPSLAAVGGLESLVGYPGERVLGQQLGVADPNASLHGAVAVLAALYHRERTGEGQYIDLSQLEALVSTLGEAILEYTMAGNVLETTGNHHPTMAPHGNYRCAGPDAWVSIAVDSEGEWRRFCVAIGSPPWTEDERFRDKFQRLRHQAALDARVSEWTATRSHREAAEILQGAGVAAAPLLDIEERFGDPHFAAREAYVQVQRQGFEPMWITGSAWKLSQTPVTPRGPAPLLGEHNDDVFGRLLGLSKEEIARLAADGAIS